MKLQLLALALLLVRHTVGYALRCFENNALSDRSADFWFLHAVTGCY